MNIRDVKRKEQLIKTLDKSRKQAEDAFVNLVVGGLVTDQDVEAAGDIKFALEHIEISLKRLRPKTCPHGAAWDDCPDCRH